MLFSSLSVIPFVALAVSALPAASTFPKMTGLNFAGYEFGIDGNGASSGSFVAFDNAQFKHFASQSSKVNLARIPIGWNYLEPTLGGGFDSKVLTKYQAAVKAALDQNMYVIIDLHNYARRDGAIINEDGPTAKQFANTWSLIAKTFKGPNILYGLMNEPHDVQMTSWVPAMQAAVDAIRDAGATDNLILLSGTAFTGIQSLSQFGSQELVITDKAHSGDPSRLIIEGHRYLDSDGTGTNIVCDGNRVSEINAYAQFLKDNKRYGLITEIGGSNDKSCQTFLGDALKAINAAYPNILGYAVWAAGSFQSVADDPTNGYALSLGTNSNGSDQPIWTNVILPAIKSS